MVWSGRSRRPPDRTKGRGVDLRQIVRSVRANWIVAVLDFLVCVGSGSSTRCCRRSSTRPASSCSPSRRTGQRRARRRRHSDRDPQIVVEADNPVIQERGAADVPARFRTPVTISATGDPGRTRSPSTRPVPTRRGAGLCQRHGGPGPEGGEPQRGIPPPALRAGYRGAPDLADESRARRWPSRPSSSVSRGVFAALARALRRLVAADEVWDRLGLPVLGEVPTLTGADRTGRDVQVPPATTGGLEAFQQLRSFLHIMFQDTSGHRLHLVRTPGGQILHCLAHRVGAGRPRAVRGGRRRRSPPADCTRSSGRTVARSERHLRGERPDGAAGVDGNRYLELIPAGVPTRHPADIAAADVPGSCVRSVNRIGRSSSIARRSRASPRRRSWWPRPTRWSSWSTHGSSISRTWSRAWRSCGHRVPMSWASC